MYCYCYILKLKSDRFYTGITNSISRRMREHLNGKSKSTKWNLPVKCIYLFCAKDRKQARLLEVKIKRQGAGNLIKRKDFVQSNLIKNNHHRKI